MKKILFAINGNHFSDGAFSFVRAVNERQPVLVTAVLLPEVDYYEMLFSLGGIAVPVIPEESDQPETFSNVKAHFEELCNAHNMRYIIHADMETNAVSQLTKESRFADFLVIGSEMFYENLGNTMQEDYIERILHKSECPVVLVPEQYTPPETIILTYDASQSSTYAIKQFSYLFPEYSNAKTLIVNIGTNRESIPDLNYIQEYVSCHFINHTFKRVEADPKKYFNTWIENFGNTMLVTGAFSRSAFSDMLKNSFITETLREHKLPIFIAHQ